MEAPLTNGPMATNGKQAHKADYLQQNKASLYLLELIRKFEHAFNKKFSTKDRTLLDGLLTEYILVLTASCSLTFAIVYSKIFAPIRELCENWELLYDLITCVYCTGFWAGMLLYWLRDQKFILVPLF